MTSEPLKHPYRANSRWALWEWCDIPSKVNPGMVYLRRLRIAKTPLVGIQLHFIYECDTDRDPHDHPRTFWSLVLRGGYIEQVYKAVYGRDFSVTVMKWPRWSWHRFHLGWAHRITQIMPGTVTLVIIGPWRKVWGFHTSEGFVPYNKYGEVLKIWAEQGKQ
jgi:hypothetical protein